MSGFFQNMLRGAVGGFFGSDYLRDYTHASKTFTPNFYQNTPKYKFLFHTYFDINQELYNAGGLDSRQNIGLLVKDIKLPDYVFDTSILNQYNRKRVVQTKIKYIPITITFHDDNASQATKIWESYYRYHYRDSDKGRNRAIDIGTNINPGITSDGGINTRNIYRDAILGDDWGLNGDAYNSSNVKVPFFNNIIIYGLARHTYTKYTLVNPIITGFTHDSYNYDQSNGIMQNTMTIEYETVLYDYGSIDGSNPENTVTGFGLDENYDRRLSPIAVPGSNRTILGQGGLVDGVGGTIDAIGRGDVLGAIKAAGTTYNTYKDANLEEIAKQEVLNGVHTALTNPAVTRNITAWIPTGRASPNPAGVAGSPTSGASDPQQSEPTAGRQVNTSAKNPANLTGIRS